MRLAFSFEAFLASPERRYVVEEKFVAWVPHTDLRGISSWGSHDRSDIARLNCVLDALTGPASHPSRWVLDQEFLTTTSPVTYYTVAESIAKRRERLKAAISRLGVVRRTGFTGTLVVQLVSMLGMSERLRFFDELGAALAWLGEDPREGWVRCIERARHGGRTDPLVSRLRVLLDECADGIGPRHAARQLGVSLRTLQRRLTAAGTTFQGEVYAGKLERAKTLMLGTTLSLTAVAFELGFTSPQHFSTRFRRSHGETPTEWLRRHRPSSDLRPRITLSSAR